MRVKKDKWKSIRLELAQSPDFPAGSASRAYIVRLPLDEHGRVDEGAFRQDPDSGTFRRHWGSEPDESGQILQLGRRWTMRAAGKPDRTLVLDGKDLHPEQHVSFVERDGNTVALRVVSIR